MSSRSAPKMVPADAPADDAVGHGMAGAGVDLGARIAEGAAVEAQLRAEAAAEAEALVGSSKLSLPS